MPYISDSRFTSFNDSDTIWRYTNFPKFVNMLETQSLYFTRADILARLDPWEGHFHKLTFLESYKTPDFISKDIEENARKEHPLYLFINCWHLNDEESDAMWKIYGKDNGIAIKTTVGKLKNSIKDTNEKIKFNKIDYRKRTKYPEVSDSFERFSVKGISFKHEDEFRLFHFDENGKNYEGKIIIVSISDLVDKILVSPLSPDWFLNIVKSIWKKYGYSETQIERSSLCENPF